MNLSGANNLSENDKSTIFTLNSSQTGQYCVVVPKNLDNSINMLVDLNMKNSFDSLVNNVISKDNLVNEINEEYSNIALKYPSGVLVFPMLDITDFITSINSNDKQKMFDETKKIGSITSEIYQKLSEAGIDKSKIDQKIILVEKTDIDKKFVSWLKEQMPNFVDGVSYDELKSGNMGSIAQNVNPFTGEASIPEAEPVNDVFGVPNMINADVVNESAPDALGSSESDSGVVEPVEQTIPDPQPVNDTKLETTQAVPNVAEVSNVAVATDDNVAPSVDNNVAVATDNNAEEVHEIDKKSGGFANLLILLVILVVVTVASIELGKFLYNSFGA